MSSVSRFPPHLSIVGGREAKSLAGIRPIRSVQVVSHPVSEIEQYKRYESHQQPYLMGDQNAPDRRAASLEDRRKANLGINRQTMLVEFRSGKSRRRQNQRGRGIDEQA
jgi:hypothetical protein